MCFIAGVFQLSACTSLGDINPNSEIAASVQQEYRRFVASAEGDLGAYVESDDGTLVRTARGPDSLPMTPLVTESIAASGGRANAYWEASMRKRQAPGARAVSVNVNDLLGRMLSQSNQLAASSDIPMIRDAIVREAEGRFDTFIFAEADYDSQDTPRSSLLETGTSSDAPDNLSQDVFGFELGVGQPLVTGGEVRLSQRVGTENSNSEFFVPDDQGSSELKLELRQPLLDGAGVLVNTAPIQLAKLERDRSVAEFQRQVEDQFSEVVKSYWTLYAERARVMQRQRLAQDLRGVSGRIKARSGIDSLAGEAQQSAAAARRAEASVIRARSGVQNAEARLSALLSDKTLFGDKVEIIPVQQPVRKLVDVPLEDVALLALQNRPEVKSAALQLRGAELLEQVAKNKLLPDLDLKAGISNGGLAGDYDVGQAMSDQFDQTGVDGFAGVQFRMPLANRTDKANYDRRRIEIRQLTYQLRNVSDTILLETQVAVREARTAFEEMRARETELRAINAEIGALQARANEGVEGGSAFLATLISGLEDRAESEQQLMEATVAYNMALYAIERAAGTMLTVRGIGAQRVTTDGPDRITLTKGGSVLATDDEILANPPAVGRRASSDYSR